MMTEADWFTSTDPWSMVGHLREKASDRKLRLFGCAASRRLWNLFEDEAARTAVEVAEAFADGEATDKERRRALLNADTLFDTLSVEIDDDELLYAITTTRFALDEDAWKAARSAAECCWCARCPETRRFREQTNLAESGLASRPGVVSDAGKAADIMERQALCELLRDIIGNPFRPLTINPSLLTDTVLNLAATIYEQRAFERMPVLADALEECGVTDAALLAHCRADTPHARGCHILDIILDKN